MQDNRKGRAVTDIPDTKEHDIMLLISNNSSYLHNV